MRARPQAPGVRSWVYLFWGDISFEGNSVGEEERSWPRCLRGRRCLRRGLWWAGCAKGGGVLTIPPERNAMLPSGLIPVSPLDVLSHLLLAATIQMIMTLELCTSFIFSLLAGRAGVRSEPRAETVEDAEVWKVLSSDRWYKGHCTR